MAEKINFDDYVEQYNKLLQEGTSFFSKDDAYFAKYKVDLMKSRVTGRVSRILEYGCGIGRNFPFLKDAFPEATLVGTDISQASLDFARSNQPDVEFFLETADFASQGEFDLIFVACVFHHVPVTDRPNVTQKLYKHLRPSGNLFIFEHNPYNPVTRRIVSQCAYDEDAELLTMREMKRCLMQAGFKDPRSEYCLFFPPGMAMLAKHESLLRWLPLGGQYFVHVTR
jgi:trans-aconitate methyltransferase